METIVLASNNENKVKEVKEILKDYKVSTLSDIGYSKEIEENGKTFEENAIIKAKTIHMYLKEKGLSYTVIADDSGLCVESLNGAPGVYSARYSGEHGNDQANRDKLQKDLENKENRNAYFICNIVLYKPNGKYEVFVGKTYGQITREEFGKKDFGYDCIFYSEDLKKTFGEATSEEKDSVSHRGRALKELLKTLKNKKERKRKGRKNMKLLMHTCCAPCSVYCINTLRKEEIEPTLYWYNPNIHPYIEYKTRRDTLKEYSKMINAELIINEEYGLDEFCKNVIGDLKNRCANYCYKVRLEQTVKYAKENGFDSFTSTLFVSPYQKHEELKRICEELAKKYEIEFLYRDFRIGFREGQAKARKLGLYMQKYCGCIFSEEDRYKKQIEKDKNSI